ncbi:GGDEF domain-containing protein [Paenibacillus sp. GSMTC-2017]|uniref:GGDEF domain-containing protein n=1 Tax=Paenibacillus sp. GSMTC-2017 TaxID=2794350 RepID=UPI0018D5E734|nr:GGDEF domain-containing protein [Paenibacillus sp. GSMTC-2017]MBH5319285.1 GGDEF domain-containing protein [Paenibacillus sp. GSMTC-2017]
MSSLARSIEDAAKQFANTLKHMVEVNTICISLYDQSMINRVIYAYNRNENVVTTGMIMPTLQTSVTIEPQHVTSIIDIPNIMEDERTATSELTKCCKASSLKSITIYKPESYVPIGSFNLIHSSPFQLSQAQQEMLTSMSSLLGYMIELEKASVTDSLTGLYNRRYLTHLCNSGSDKLYSVLFIDIDDFKEVNDQFGHDTGDALLLEIAGRLKQNVRKSDVLIRYGGDEFLICFQHLAQDQDMKFVSDKIEHSLREPYTINGQSINIYASVGISSKQGGGSTLRELISDADQSMYTVKNNEKNQ